MFCLLPLVVGIYSLSPSTTWKMCASFLAVSLTGFLINQLIAVTRLARAGRSVSRWAAVILTIGMIVTIVLQIVGIVSTGIADATYVSGILVLLFLATVQFVVFVVRILIGRS